MNRSIDISISFLLILSASFQIEIWQITQLLNVPEFNDSKHMFLLSILFIDIIYFL